MNVIESFERGFAFRLTRVFALLAISIVVISVIAAGAFLYSSLKQMPESAVVTPAEVVASIIPSEDAGSKQTDVGLHLTELNSVSIPFVLQKHLDADDLSTLNSWLKDVSEERRSEFLSELASAVEQAERSHIDSADVMNQYHKTKMSKLARQKQDEDRRRTYLITYGCIAAGGLVLIVQFSIILVLLAVERNTRKTS